MLSLISIALLSVEARASVTWITLIGESCWYSGHQLRLFDPELSPGPAR